MEAGGLTVSEWKLVDEHLEKMQSHMYYVGKLLYKNSCYLGLYDDDDEDELSKASFHLSEALELISKAVGRDISASLDCYC